MEELRKRGIDGLIGPKAGNIFRDGMATGKGLRREVTASLEDGSRITVDIAGFPIRNAKGEITNFAGIGRDITDLKAALSELKKANRELRETQTQLVQSAKMASLGQFVAGIAHEINTPVGAIRSMHNTLVRGIEKLKPIIMPKTDGESPESEELTSVMKIIEDANQVIDSGTERVTTIVKRLRSFARLDEAELKTVDIHEGLEDTLTLIHHEIKHHITVKKEYGDIPQVACFPGMLNQVFLNILANAWQAIPGKGVITIRTSLEGESIHIAITDDGEGIVPDNLKRIFDPGFTTKGVGVGTGLGLSICFQIIKDHRGDIKVESEPGSGTTFTIVLPTNLEDLLAAEKKGESPKLRRHGGNDEPL